MKTHLVSHFAKRRTLRFSGERIHSNFVTAFNNRRSPPSPLQALVILPGDCTILAKWIAFEAYDSKGRAAANIKYQD